MSETRNTPRQNKSTVISQFVIDEILTLGPGAPTLPALPGKPVAPYQHEKT